MIAMKDGSTVEVGVIGCEGILGIQSFLGTRTISNVAIVQVAGGSIRLLLYTHYLVVHIAQTAACNRVHLLEQRLCRRRLLVNIKKGWNRLPANVTELLPTTLISFSKRTVFALGGDRISAL